MPMVSRRRSLAVLVLVLAVVLLRPMAPAWAHAELESSDPADGSTLTTVPTDVSLTFGEDLLAEGNGLTAKSVTSGRAVELTGVALDGDRISADWPQGTPSGAYELAYRVVSADGHPVEGAIDFTITLPVGGATVTVAPQASAPSTPVAESPSATNTPESSDDGGSSLIAWIVGFLIVIAVGSTAGMWIMRRANRM